MTIEKLGSGYMVKYGKLVVACDLSRSGAIRKAIKRLIFKGYIRQ